MSTDDGETTWANDFWLDHIHHDTKIDSAAKEDIFQWATFVICLLTNHLAIHNKIDITKPEWSLCTPACPERSHAHGSRDEGVAGFKLHDSADWLLNLRPEQLSSVLVKAFKGQFESASEVLVDLRQALKDLGREVDEHDDISPSLGRSWSDIFTTVKGKEGEYRECWISAWAREIKFIGDHIATEDVANDSADS